MSDLDGIIRKALKFSDIEEELIEMVELGSPVVDVVHYIKDNFEGQEQYYGLGFYRGYTKQKENEVPDGK